MISSGSSPRASARLAYAQSYSDWLSGRGPEEVCGRCGTRVRPGSFVQIDANQRKVLAGPWATELDRPIYFVEVRDDGYVCCWCELHGKELWLVPHPKSGRSIQRFEHGRGAEIVGQITGVAMRIASTPRKPVRRRKRK
jgi:hypothetical protein